MSNKQQYWTGITAVLAMLILILDAPTALQGAHCGLEVALYTVIPALFPFIITSSVLNRLMLGKRIPVLSVIGRLCGVPDGAESLLLLGLIGGYPVGAQMVADSYKTGQLDRSTAQRLLGFCNNAGPSFLFGMIGPMFSQPIVPILLWIVHIISALIVGSILPGKNATECRILSSDSINFPKILEHGIRTVAIICGWVILSRIFIAVCEKWFVYLLPDYLQVLFTGMIELSNGCIALQNIQDEGIRMVVASCILACGGLCVGMQTISVTKGLGTGMYIQGKALQVGLSFIMSALLRYALYPTTNSGLFVIPLLIALLLTVGSVLSMHKRQKKVVAFP